MKIDHLEKNLIEKKLSSGFDDKTLFSAIFKECNSIFSQNCFFFDFESFIFDSITKNSDITLEENSLINQEGIVRYNQLRSKINTKISPEYILPKPFNYPLTLTDFILPVQIVTLEPLIAPVCTNQLIEFIISDKFTSNASTEEVFLTAFD